VFDYRSEILRHRSDPAKANRREHGQVLGDLALLVRERLNLAEKMVPRPRSSAFQPDSVRHAHRGRLRLLDSEARNISFFTPMRRVKNS
jgi:hypothetical protein